MSNNLPNADSSKKWVNELNRKRESGPRLQNHHQIEPDLGLATKAVHAGTYADKDTGAIGTPIFQTTTFKFQEQTYEAFFSGATRDYPIYTRYGNPNQLSLQEKVAALEGTQSSLVLSSGMAAIATTILALTNNGGHIISSYDVYGGTYNLFREDMHQLGREVTFIDPNDIQSLKDAIKDNTQMLFFESLSNPLLKCLPLKTIGKIATENQLLLVIDNTFLTPVFCRPYEYGADIVIHSATKYLNGHSDVTAGVCSGSRKLIDRVWAQMLRLGGHLDPLACFLLERGLKTLQIRMKKHHENAQAMVDALDKHPNIVQVYHPSLRNSETPTELEEICQGQYGGMLSFEVKGGDKAALFFMDNLKFPQVATSLGGVESLVSMPFNTSHSSLSEKQRREVGIKAGLVRLSIGIEDISDLIDDVTTALDAVNDLEVTQ